MRLCCEKKEVSDMYQNNSAYGVDMSRRYMETAPARKRKRNWRKTVLSLILCGALFGSAAAAAFTGTNALLKNGQAAGEKSAASQTQSAAGLSTVSFSSDTSASSQTLDVSDIAEGMMPAMVSITNISVQEVQSYFGMFGRGRTQTQQSQSSGTGIIIGENSSELLIVTNNHVVEDATTLSVCFVDDEVCEASIKGTDPDNDLAVISVKLSSIKSQTAEVIKSAKIGNSDELKVGEQVVAIGNALGYGQSVTTGIVSALNRQIDDTDAVMIQTDAAINPGNSGGALVNMNGEVVGINSAKFSSTDVEGMGYAISITTATPIIEDLMNRTTREKVSDENASYLGIKGEEITASVSSAYGIPQGVYITAVNSDSPLTEVGIPAKSVLTHFDGVRVTSCESLEDRLQYYAAGETVEITFQVLEGNKYTEKTVSVTLAHASVQTARGDQSDFGYGAFGRL
ncbi:MAG: trypsin-like peptidase domain-containing protein [Clostridia bacterium]|nr:trypsin-like peptidase domain-containing protein [Clostridia bacterium]